MLFKNSVSEVVDSNAGERSLIHKISNESIDCYNHVLTAKGMDESRWRAILYQHNYGEMSWFSETIQLPSELIPAKKEWFSTEKKQVLCKANYLDTTLGNDLYYFYKDGLMSGSSVGWSPKGEKVFNEETKVTTYKEWYIYEWSHVLFPANYDTEVVEESKKMFDNLELMRKEAKDENLKNIIVKEYDYAKIKIDLKTSMESNANLTELVNNLKNGNPNSEEITKLNNEITEIKNQLAKKVTVENVVKKARTKSEYLSIFNGAFSEFTGRKY